MRTYAHFKKYERMLLTVIAKTSGYMKESEPQEDRKEPSMGEGKLPASGKKKGHKNQLLKPLSTSRLKPFVNGKPHTWSKKVPPFQAASINYSNVFNLQYSGIFSDHGSKSSM